MQGRNNSFLALLYDNTIYINLLIPVKYGNYTILSLHNHFNKSLIFKPKSYKQTTYI